MKGITLPAVLALLSGCTSTTAVLEENGTLSVKSERSTLLGSVASLMKDARDDHLAICKAASLSRPHENELTLMSTGSTQPGLERATKSLNTIKGAVGIFPAHSVEFAVKCGSEGSQASLSGRAILPAAPVPRPRRVHPQCQGAGPGNRTLPAQGTRCPR